MRLIDADALKKQVIECDLEKPEKITFRWMISQQPTIDAVPVVHGRWEEQDYDWSEAWKCSACGEEWCFEYDPTEPTTRVNYCPNCGARMDGE